MDDKKMQPPWKTCFGSNHMTLAEESVERLYRMSESESKELDMKLQAIAREYDSGGP